MREGRVARADAGWSERCRACDERDDAMHDGRVDGVEGALITWLHAEVGAALRWCNNRSGAPGNAVSLFLYTY